MGILSFFNNKSKPIERVEPRISRATNVATALTLQNPNGWQNMWDGMAGQKFGSPVSVQTAMQSGVVFRCIQLVAGVVGSVDLGVYQDDPIQGRINVPGQLQNMLRNVPYAGRQMTAFKWKETGMANQLAEGNWYSAIRFNQAGRVQAIEYIHPRLVTNVKIVNGVVQYTVQWNDGRGTEIIPCEDMIHVSGPSQDGIVGMSRIRAHAKNAIALALSIEEVQGKAHDNAVNPSGLLEMPQGMSGDAKTALMQFITNEFSGRDKTGMVLPVDAGTKFTAMNINTADLALLAAMNATSIQIAMFFGIPPYLLGLPQTSSFGTGIDSIMQSWLQLGLNSELENIEAELTAKLCTIPGQYIMFDREQLLNMDAETAANVARTETSFGGTTVNEYRKSKHRPLVDGGDVPLTNAANIPLTEAIQAGRGLVPINTPQPAPIPTTSKPQNSSKTE